MKLLLERLFDAWNEAKLRYLILRNYEELPEYTGNDVDILLDPAQLTGAQALLEKVAAKSGWRIHNVGEFSCKAFYLYHIDTLEQLHLDLMCGDKWYSFFFVDHALMLTARQPFKTFFKPDPVHEAAVNLMTRLLYGGYVKEKYRAGVQRSAVRDHQEMAEALTPWLGAKLAQGIVAQAGGGKWKAIEAQTSKVRKKVLLANLRNPARLISSLWDDVLRFVRRLLWSPGISVVFFGPDGCGKTSVADGLKQNLLKTFYPERSLHCHWKPIPQQKGSAPTEDPHAIPPRGRALSLVYFIYHYLPFIWGWWRYIKPVLFKNGLVIIDRYYYDFFVDLRRYRLNLPQWIVKLGFVFVKKPDLVFCLDADPEILQARKQEVSLEECKRQREAYRALAQKLPNGHVIDASQPLDDVVRDVQSIVLNYMAERTAKRMRRRV
jgi:thymidylate kinase